MSLSEQEDQEIYVIERSFLVFLFVLDELGLSGTLRNQLVTTYPVKIIDFMQKHEKQREPLKVIKLF